jgi:hypothetical protein
VAGDTLITGELVSYDLMRREQPSFESLCEIIREQCQLRPDERIVSDTQFERDLGITGDDGDEVLHRVEEYYSIRFSAESFNLSPNEFLFHSEGFDLFKVPIRMILRKPEPEIRSFTVGELFEATSKEYLKQRRTKD